MRVILLSIALLFPGNYEQRTNLKVADLVGSYKAEAFRPERGTKIDGVKAEWYQHVTLILSKDQTWEFRFLKQRFSGTWHIEGRQIHFKSNDKDFDHQPVSVRKDNSLLTIEGTKERTRVLYKKKKEERKR